MLDEKITHLVLSGYFGWLSSDLTFVDSISFVERLDLMVPRVEDVTPLYRLPRLQELSVGGNVAPIDFTKIPSLRKLFLDWAPKRFGSLVECIQLEELGISYLREPDLRLLRKLNNLTVLTIGYSTITSLNGIQNMPSLDFLGLARVNKLTSLEYLQSCRRVTRLRIEGAKLLRDVAALGVLGNLESAVFMDCPALESILSLAGHKKLWSLGLLATTNVRDGDLLFMRSLPSLKNATVRDRKHYTVKNSDLPKQYGTTA